MLTAEEQSKKKDDETPSLHEQIAQLKEEHSAALGVRDGELGELRA